MKKGIIIGIVQTVSKYWQDVLRKPNQVWIKLYGYNNESVQESMARTIVEALESPVNE